MKIDIDNANAYFALDNHAMAETWNKYGLAHRKGAIVHARRMLEQELRRPMRETDADGDRRRDDYAVFEQALWLLMGSPYGNAADGDAVAILEGRTVDAAAAADTYGTGRRERWSREALRWLGWNGAYTVRA